MKILELRFKNLNSLYGEWLIDFTDPEYASNGIFVLTGPTGAGKSTILDAICLALYGATPRLGKITKNWNEIMSRKTGECYAEVLFESQAGRFRCHWEQRRARKSAEGNLQDQEHQIADANTGRPIETKKSLVGRVIEEKTGMDFDRFTRSILLAQGGFDTFLKADVEQKSRILEQITGTEIYSEISRRVHIRQRDEREKLNLLNAETSGIVILNPEEEKEIQETLGLKLKEEGQLAVKSAACSRAVTWLTAIEGLKKEILDLAEEDLRLKKESELFKPERARLEQAVKAASLDADFATLSSLRKQQTADQVSLKKDELEFPVLEKSAKTQAESLKAAELQSLKAKNDVKEAAPLIQKVRALDLKIGEKAKTVLEKTEACAKESAKIINQNQLRQKEFEKRTSLEKRLKAAELYINENKHDEWLSGGLTGVEEQIGSLLSRQKELSEKEETLKAAESTVLAFIKKQQEASKLCTLKKQELAAAGKQVQGCRAELKKLLGEKLLREYRAEKEALLREMVYIKKIVELEDHRKKLEDGKPCPLCGSAVHPYAEGNVPVADETEHKIDSLTRLISKAEEQENTVKKMELAEIAARSLLNESEKVEVRAANESKAAEKTVTDIKEALLKLQESYRDLKLAVSTKLKPLGFTEIPESQVGVLLESLKARLKNWQDRVKQKTEKEKELVLTEGELKHHDAVIADLVKELNEKEKNLKDLKSELAKLQEERKQLYAEKNPDEEEERLNKSIADSEKVEKEARELNSERQQKLTMGKTRIDALRKNIEDRIPELQKAESDFLTALTPAGFTDEKSFLEARLSLEVREALSSRAKALEDAGTELKARQKDRETRLAAELARKLSDRTLAELEPEHKEFEESLKQVRDIIAAIKHKLSENTTARERIKDKQAAIELQKKECQRWDKLHALIGSSDGKKYRNFTQGLTFELMVSHANRQLEKMTDRYQLMRDEQQPLELNVVDNYQAGEIRSTKNLSGGESFIVSLALALGLSKMASRKVRVDSLFLDEGFGTLDDEALETALETLSGLQQGSKLIGIISHVAALKERISTQIDIAPAFGGRSTVTGPGCIQLK